MRTARCMADIQTSLVPDSSEAQLVAWHSGRTVPARFVHPPHGRGPSTGGTITERRSLAGELPLSFARPAVDG